jgi:hypothetical protein
MSVIILIEMFYFGAAGFVGIVHFLQYHQKIDGAIKLYHGNAGSAAAAAASSNDFIVGRYLMQWGGRSNGMLQLWTIALDSP